MNSSKFILDVNETTFQWSTNVSNKDAFILPMIEIRVSGTQTKIYLSKVYVLLLGKLYIPNLITLPKSDIGGVKSSKISGTSILFCTHLWLFQTLV